MIDLPDTLKLIGNHNKKRTRTVLDLLASDDTYIYIETSIAWITQKANPIWPPYPVAMSWLRDVTVLLTITHQAVCRHDGRVLLLYSVGAEIAPNTEVLSTWGSPFWRLARVHEICHGTTEHPW